MDSSKQQGTATLCREKEYEIREAIAKRQQVPAVDGRDLPWQLDLSVAAKEALRG